MLAMGLSMLIISSIFFLFKDPSLFWVFLAYGLGGVGIGTFESNLLSTIAPLGKETKLFAIIGIPVTLNSLPIIKCYTDWHHFDNCWRFRVDGKWYQSWVHIFG
jgi:hypothetical protein